MKSTLVLAAATGILMGLTACGNKSSSNDNKPAVEKHACKGQNACKGQGGCKSDTHACKGQNACKGQGGCKG